jgi:hypothetical protein
VSHASRAGHPGWRRCSSLKEEILLTQASINALLRRLPEKDVPTSRELGELIDRLRRLSEIHARMAKDLHQMLSLDKVLSIFDRAGRLAVQHVRDPEALRAIQLGMEEIIGPARNSG